MMRINRSIKVLVILALCLPVLPTVGRADVEINILGVTPVQPLYEVVGDTAVLNSEMTFENRGLAVGLVSWKVRNYYLGGVWDDAIGTPEDFWFNVRIYDLNPWQDLTEDHAGYFKDGVYNPGDQLIPENARVVFFLPYTDYPLNHVPGLVTVSVKFKTVTLAEREINFYISPSFHWTDQQYIFPVGSEEMGADQEWAMTDGHAPDGDLHGAGHELYTGHRRFHMWWDGLNQPVLCDQRYAHDIAILDKDGSDHAEFPDAGADPVFRQVTYYYAWEKKVFAMADGTVVSVQRDQDDNPIAGVISYPDQVNKYPAGNHLVIDHHNGEFSVYAHLRKGSIPEGLEGTQQEPGQVIKGQEIGRIGNSGNTSGPHLHFVLADRPHVRVSDSLPIRFTNISIKRVSDPDFIDWTTSLPSGVKIRIN